MFAIRERKLTAMLLAVFCISGGSAAMAAPLMNPQDDVGLEMRRQREEAELERLRQQMEEDQERQDEKVQGDTETPADAAEDEVKFLLNEVTIDESTIITADKFNKIKEPYLGKEVSLADLSDIVKKINAIYTAGGYATCKAYLPQQTIENGNVHIGLIEGKTGDVSISGNKHTKDSYIRNRLPLQSGTIQDFNELNEKLARFNGTNDAYTFLCGHDSNIASVLAALEAEEYELPDSIEKKTPIGSKLVIEKYLGKDGSEYASLSLIYQSTQQLRERTSLSLEQPPVIFPIHLSGMHKNSDGLYRLEDLMERFHKAINAYDMLPADADRKAA